LQGFFVNIIDRVSLAPVLEGRVEREMSGPGMSAQISMARSLFGRALNNVAIEWSAMAEWMLRMIDTEIRAPVPLYKRDTNEYIEIGPSDIDGYYVVEHQVDPIIQLEQSQKQIMAADLHARKLVDDMYVLEQSGVPNHEEMSKRVRIQSARAMPQYQNNLLAEAFAIINARLRPSPPGTAEGFPLGPGGANIPQQAGVQQGLAPGMEANPMAVPPEMAAGGNGAY
jgi:hypothetical protein